MNKKILYALLAVLLLGGFAYAWQDRAAQPIAVQSQQQAETSDGVATAAQQAKVIMLEQQLTEAAREIARLKNKPPVTVVTTVPAVAAKTIETARQKAGADFAIVTDPNRPDTKFDFNKFTELAPDTQVTLNQYNVYAYKKIIRGVTIYPEWSDTLAGRPKLQEVAVDVNRRISKNGKYIGVAAGYDFKHEQAKLGLRVMF